MWHLVCGDNAVAGVTHVIGAHEAEAGLRVLRDDLAVGPLADVDTPPCAARAAFWRALWPESVRPVPDFATDLPADARWLAGLARQARPVSVWHGEGFQEQAIEEGEDGDVDANAEGEGGEAAEGDLLHALMQKPGAVLSIEQLENKLYGWGQEVSSNAIEVHLHHLRRKLGGAWIKNVRGVGYKLVAIE